MVACFLTSAPPLESNSGTDQTHSIESSPADTTCPCTETKEASQMHVLHVRYPTPVHTPSEVGGKQPTSGSLGWTSRALMTRE